MRRPARDGQAEVGQGQRVVQDRRAQLVDPDRGQAVVAGQAAELAGSPQGLVIAACAAGPGVGDVDEAERRRVLEEHAQRIPAFHDVPGPRAGVAERAVVGVGDVEPPQGPQAPGRDQRRLLSPQEGEYLADAGPRAGRQRGQARSHGGAPGDGRGQRPGLALALDGVDPGQLVVRHAPQPPVPQGRERLVGRAGQRRAAACRELEPRAGQPGQAAELDQQRPRERRDGLAGVVEIPRHQDVVDQLHGRGGRAPAGRVPYLPVGGQLQDADQVGQRVRRRAPDQDRTGVNRPAIEEAGFTLGHQQTLTARRPARQQPRRTRPGKPGQHARA